MQLQTSDLNALYKRELNKVGGASMMSVNILALKRSIIPDLIVNRLLRSGVCFLLSGTAGGSAEGDVEEGQFAKTASPPCLTGCC